MEPLKFVADPRDELGREATTTTAAKSIRDFIEKSGWSESNRRLPRPKRGTLTRLSYTPSPFERAHSMTVRTDEFALLNLLQNSSTAVPVDKPPEIISFRRTRQVIPVHGRRVEPTATIDARPVLQ